MTDPTKEPYTPPAVRRISLASDELAATACKAVLVAMKFCKKGVSLFSKAIGS